MKPEYWERTQQLYHAALERDAWERAAWLAQACADDAALRHEVESLLAASAEVGDFLLSPALRAEARALAAEQLLPTVGQQLNQYQLISWLGAGGMGEVYLAQDSKLKRKVALKLLHARFTQDAEQARRFAREAKAASALNHPNIITIHETGEVGATRFIAAEYIEGVTLRQRMMDNKLELREALEIALQVVAALAAAHQAGIVHRDIKPENIMLRPDGLVKVLDFGLARITEPLLLAAEGQSANSSETGAVVGTPRYMSPEQARGEKVDALADIFSLGVVLYEMIAQQVPFTGATMAEVFAALLTTEPEPLVERAAGSSAELQGIVSRALAKERAQRYQSIQELQADLQTQLAQLQQAGGQVSSSRRPWVKRVRLPVLSFTGRRWGLVTAGLLAVLLVAGMAWQFLHRAAPSSESVLPTNLRISDLFNVSNRGGISSPSFSPDGKWIAYSLNNSDGEKHLWIKQVSGGEPKQITEGKFKDYTPTWSPDGRELAFVSDRGGADSLWSVPYLSGTPKLLGKLERNSSLAKWSRDGQRIYFGSNKTLYVFDLATKQISLLTHFKKIPAWLWSVSPDEKQAAYLGPFAHIFVTPISGGEPRQISTGKSVNAGGAAWFPDGNRIAYTFGGRIYLAWLDGRLPVPITSSHEHYGDLAISPDGTRIVAALSKANANLFACDLLTRSEIRQTLGDNERLASDISPDGTTIVYQANADPVWRWGSSLFIQSRIAGSQPYQLTPTGLWAKWSPIGAELAFLRHSDVWAGVDLWKVNASGRAEQRLATSLVGDLNFGLPYNPATIYDWSPDGKQIAYCSDKSGQMNVWVVASDGSSDVMVSHYTDPKQWGGFPLWSPDGKRLAYDSKLDEKWRINVTEQGKTKIIYEHDTESRLIGWSASGREILVLQATDFYGQSPQEMSLLGISLAGEKPRVILHRPAAFLHNARLSRDGGFIAYASRQDGKDNIEIVPTNGGPIRKLTSNHDPTIFYSGLVWAPDGKTLFYSKETAWTQVSLIENFK